VIGAAADGGLDCRLALELGGDIDAAASTAWSIALRA